MKYAVTKLVFGIKCSNIVIINECYTLARLSWHLKHALNKWGVKPHPLVRSIQGRGGRGQKLCYIVRRHQIYFKKVQFLSRNTTIVTFKVKILLMFLECLGHFSIYMTNDPLLGSKSYKTIKQTQQRLLQQWLCLCMPQTVFFIFFM